LGAQALRGEQPGAQQCERNEKLFHTCFVFVASFRAGGGRFVQSFVNKSVLFSSVSFR
jgi:hypothetical protein